MSGTQWSKCHLHSQTGASPDQLPLAIQTRVSFPTTPYRLSHRYTASSRYTGCLLCLTIPFAGLDSLGHRTAVKDGLQRKVKTLLSWA